MGQLECREEVMLVTSLGTLEKFLEQELEVREYELAECEELMNDTSWEATVEPVESKPET